MIVALTFPSKQDIKEVYSFLKERFKNLKKTQKSNSFSNSLNFIDSNNDSIFQDQNEDLDEDLNRVHLTPNQIIDVYLLGNNAWYIVQPKANINLPPTSTNDKLTYKSNLPLLDESRCRYFEIEIYQIHKGSTFMVGFCRSYFNENQLLGDEAYSIGFNLNNGKVYFTPHIQALTTSKPSLDAPITIGCGLTSLNKVFFTLNGKLLTLAHSPTLHYSAYPSISYQSTQPISIKSNFGERSFQYLDANYRDMAMVPRRWWVQHRGWIRNSTTKVPDYNECFKDVLWLG